MMSPQIEYEKRVLVVDDDIDFAESLSDALSLHGFEVKTANNAAAAKEKVELWNPQVAVVDNQLGATRGVDLIPQLKERSPQIMCVMITAYSVIDAAIRSLKAGASDYLRKPISPEEIVRSLENCFDKAQLQDRRIQAELALMEREAKLNAIMDNVGEGIFTISRSGLIESSNPAAHRLFGYETGTMTDLDVTKVIPGGVTALEAAADIRNDDVSTAGWTVGRRKTGEDFNMELSVGRMKFNDQHVYIATMRDVSDRLRRQAELQEAKTEAEIANRAKSEFLANVSHELRTPLNAVLGFSEMLLTAKFGPLGHNLYHDYANFIHDSGEHLLAIISDILDVSKIEAGKLVMQEDEVDVSRLCDSAMSLVKGRAQGKKISLTREVPDDLPDIFVDPRILKQVLINLLSNAVKFTEEDGSVILEAHVTDDGGFQFVVRDNGIGIAEENLASVLLPFGQVHDIYTKNHEGTGLGLPLAKRLTEIHDGTLTLISEIEVGTSVMVDLPAARILPKGT
jgi:PAS domain S-box-containing protein